MATVVNNPQPAPVTNNGSGFLIGVILLVLAAIAFFYYVLPYIGSGLRTTQVNVPDKVDVNVQQQQPK